MPLARPTGTVESYLNWMLSQPDAELIGPGVVPMPLRSPLGRRPRPRSMSRPFLFFSSSTRSRSAPDRVRIARRSRFVAGSCGDLDPQLTRSLPLARRRSWPMPVPEPTAPGRYRRGGAAGLSKRGRSTCSACSSYSTGSARIVTPRARLHLGPRRSAEASCPTALCSRAPLDAGAIVERYDLTRAGDARRASVAGDAARLDAARLRRLWPRPAGGGAEHRHALRQSGRGMGATVAGETRWRHRRLSSTAPRHVFAAGTTTRDEWFGGPITSSRIAPTAPWATAALPPGGLLPARDISTVRSTRPGHQAVSLYLDEFAGQALPGRELIPRATIRSSCRLFVPPERHDYRSRLLVSSATAPSGSDPAAHDRVGVQLAAPRGDHQATPLLSIDYYGSRRPTRRRRGKPFSFYLGLPHAARGGREATRARERRGLVGRRDIVDRARRGRVSEVEVVHGQAEESRAPARHRSGSPRPTRPDGR